MSLISNNLKNSTDETSALYNLAKIAISRDENTNIDKPLLDFLKAQFIELTTDNQNLYKELQKNYKEKEELSDNYYEILRENTNLKYRLQDSEKLGKSKSSMIKDFKVKNTPYNRKR
jgi:hypothetical protein